jgi:16S rRNA (adenine1518-N6/adenine1519-N6)-dimethyltransferase
MAKTAKPGKPLKAAKTAKHPKPSPSKTAKAADAIHAAVAEFPMDPLRDQFFLKDESSLQKIVSLAGLSKSDTVLEIGAGDGRLTEALAGKCKKVIAVEMDERLRPVLSKKFEKTRNVELLFGNALRLLPRLSGKYNVIVSNPPYSISEPLVKLLFGASFRHAVLTLPSDFVGRLAANPQEPAFSKLSLFASAFFRIETLLPVGKDAWEPMPRVGSVVVRLTPMKPASGRDRLVRSLALQSDKKLGNALREALAGLPGGTKRKARGEVSRAGIRQDLLGKRVASMSTGEIREVLEAFK